MKNDRRDFLKTLSLLPLISVSDYSDKLIDITNEHNSISLPELGKINIKTSKELPRSPFGIGCETLDRELWDPKEIYPWMDDLSVKWARLQTGWARVERIKGVYDWQWLDESVDGLLQRGFTPFFNVGYGNTHYTEGDMGYHPLISDEAYAAWKRFVKALARRYKNKIKYYEIWNEPNLTSFWKPGEVDPEKYVRIVRDTGKIIRKNCPDAVIIGGVLSRLPFNFTRAMFEHGLAKEIDIFSFHPYGVIPESYNDQLKALRKYIDQYDPKIKIWQGENGYPSEPGSSGFNGEPPWTENIQAKIMLRRLINDCMLGIDMSLWFLIVDIHDYPKGTGRVNYKGILKVKPKIERKVAFTVLQHLGSTIYGNVNVRNSITYCYSANTYKTDEALAQFKEKTGNNLTNVCSGMLNSDKGKVLAYWDTVKAADNYKEENCDLILFDWEGKGFEEPVLIDLFSGQIYDLSKNITRYLDNGKFRLSHDAQIFQQLPLRDYPMLIMERGMFL